MIAAIITAASASPSAPKVDWITGRKTKLFQRITPCSTLVKAGPSMVISGFDSRVMAATISTAITALAPAAPALPPDRSAFQIAGIRKPGYSRWIDSFSIGRQVASGRKSDFLRP